MAMTRRLWSLNGLAVELGRDRRTFSSALASVRPDGKAGRHDAWFITTALAALQPLQVPAGQLDAGQERARKDRALAVATEVKNDIAAAAVVPIDVVVGAIAAQYGKVRNKLLSIPTKVAPRAAALKSAEEVRALVEAEIVQALVELTGDGEGHVTLEEARMTVARFAEAGAP